MFISAFFLVRHADAEVAAIVSVIVVVDEEKQTPVVGNCESLLAADEKRPRRSSISEPDVADERAVPCIGQRIACPRR